MRFAGTIASLGAAALIFGSGVVAMAAPAPPPPPQAQQQDQASPPQQQPQQQQASPPAPSQPRAAPAPPTPGTAPTTPAPDVPAAEDEAPVDLSHAWTYSRRRAAPEPRYVRPPDVAVAPNPQGFYSGVSTTGNQVPPAPPPELGTKPVQLTWTGFERIDGGTQVYFQLSADVAYEVTETPGRVVIRMRNTRANTRNNMRPLDLRFFPTPARAVKLHKRGRDLVATIELKRRTTPVIELVPGQAGYRLLVVRFDEAKPPDIDRPPVRR